jgi:hypothetical protein
VATPYNAPVTTDLPAIATEPRQERNAAVSRPNDDARQDSSPTAKEATPAGKKVRLRLTRDSKQCAKAACLKWHLVQRRSKPPRGASLDIARLHLDPGLREAAESGEVQLIVDAVEQHKTINGRDNITYIATNLAAVAPLGKQP